MISALTWWVGRINAFEVESATISAYIAGLAPVANAMLTEIGTRMVVAPTFDITRLKIVAITASATWMVSSGTSPRMTMISWAIQAAVPVRSIACPSGIRLASRKTVFQLTDRYASSMLSTPVSTMPIAPTSSEMESR